MAKDPVARARRLSRDERGFQIDTPLTDDERAEIEEMPSHELYLLTCMTKIGTRRAVQVNELYSDCLRRVGRENRRA